MRWHGTLTKLWVSRWCPCMSFKVYHNKCLIEKTVHLDISLDLQILSMNVYLGIHSGHGPLEITTYKNPTLDFQKMSVNGYLHGNGIPLSVPYWDDMSLNSPWDLSDDVRECLFRYSIISSLFRWQVPDSTLISLLFRWYPWISIEVNYAHSFFLFWNKRTYLLNSGFPDEFHYCLFRCTMVSALLR